MKKSTNKKRKAKSIKSRSLPALGLALRTGGFAGKHHTRDKDVLRGSSRKAKHKERLGNYVED